MARSRSRTRSRTRAKRTRGTPARINRIVDRQAADAQSRSLALEEAIPPQRRMGFAAAITVEHHTGDMSASVREKFDEPFEQQQVCFELNSIQGPWAERESGNALRWLPVKAADLEALETGNDFLFMVFRHLVPVGAES